MAQYTVWAQVRVQVDADNAHAAGDVFRNTLERVWDSDALSLDVTVSKAEKVLQCRCCGHEIHSFIAGASVYHRLCDDCGRLKCDDCRGEVRAILDSTAVQAEAEETRCCCHRAGVTTETCCEPCADDYHENCVGPLA
ncbi:hypothetical protein [Mycolicibacterium sphagni]|uniref:hypothetical protein n=1 Tax=Mycolicibacterium sphagni TaxID=1786 RepID=UPI0021F3491D|nr:hypothetical protein [Mycolicibacterium sphagni]MCV7174906.1 hypothetical protein [Mycolicibacterium sphagni]